MTLPIERTRAVIELAKEVRALAPYVYGKGETVRMPRELLRRLHAWLRHYPEPSELTVTAKLAPHLWASAAPATGECGSLIMAQQAKLAAHDYEPYR